MLVMDSLINLLLTRRIAAMGPYEQEEGNEEKSSLSITPEDHLKHLL